MEELLSFLTLEKSSSHQRLLSTQRLMSSEELRLDRDVEEALESLRQHAEDDYGTVVHLTSLIQARVARSAVNEIHVDNDQKESQALSTVTCDEAPLGSQELLETEEQLLFTEAAIEDMETLSSKSIDTGNRDNLINGGHENAVEEAEQHDLVPPLLSASRGVRLQPRAQSSPAPGIARSLPLSMPQSTSNMMSEGNQEEDDEDPDQDVDPRDIGASIQHIARSLYVGPFGADSRPRRRSSLFEPEH